MHRVGVGGQLRDGPVYGGREPDVDDEDNGDGEPSLGSFDRMTNQEKSWRVGGKHFWRNGHDFEFDPADGRKAGTSGKNRTTSKRTTAIASRREFSN